jgi:hypothetical protein
MKKNDDKKCAPSKKYTDGSCFSNESLIKIANKYNEKNTDKIDITLSKKELVNILNNKLSNKCSEQICWLRLNFVKELENKDILENTFRPEGPKDRYEWLSTNHINDVIEQYHHVKKNFLFLGAVPYDFEDLDVLGIADIDFKELQNNGKTELGMVINLDEHYKSGSHWVGLYINLDKNQIYYFDSTGSNPGSRIKKFITRVVKYMYKKKYNENININQLINGIKNNKNNKYFNNIKNFDIRYNNIQHQFENSECGVYSINFIERLIMGESFNKIIHNVIKDDKINLRRKEFFRNINF